jgi:hypothetical protein
MKNHKWIDAGSYQWGANGDSASSAHTNYKCELCGAEIAICYHNNDTHESAMKRAGIPQECSGATESEKTGKEKKIFCFINSSSPGWNVVLAMCEDGHVLAEHCSSNEGWAKHDIGIGSDWKHEHYKEHCPDGYELIWLSEEEAEAQFSDQSSELSNAYAKNQELAKVAETTK